MYGRDEAGLGYERVGEGGSDPICDGEGDWGWGIIGRCLRYGSRLFGVEVLIWS